MARIWFDTEFIEDGRTIDLLSIGLVREDGAELYLESDECDRSKASTWVRENVFPHLTGLRDSRFDIARHILNFAGDAPEFWSYYSDYDWVALCQLYGTMMDLPKGWPMFCLDVQQIAHTRQVKITVPQVAEHSAIHDARWTRDAWYQVTGAVFPADAKAPAED